MRLLFLTIIICFLSVSAIAADLVYFDSPEGMKRLEQSQAKVDFFPLANHFESQQNKVFCGIASSVIILNTLRLDNPDIKKPEDNSLLTKEDRRYFPKGFDPIYQRYTQNTLLNAETKNKDEVLGKPVNINGKTIANYGLQLKELSALLTSYGLNVTTRVANDNIKDEAIHTELINNLKTSGNYVLVNYSRKILGQGNGGGHISPLGAYDLASDSFLIMDVNPNTSKWVWVKTTDLIKAMRTFDTTENRGYLLVKEGN